MRKPPRKLQIQRETLNQLGTVTAGERGSDPVASTCASWCAACLDPESSPVCW